MRWSAESRCDTQLPLQSRCCELPTVDNIMLSRLVAGSGTIGNELLAAMGLPRRQLPGIGPVSSPFSPVIWLTNSPYWSEFTVFVPGGPKMFPSTYADGSPLISGLLVVK